MIIDQLEKILNEEYPILARMIHRPTNSALVELLNDHIERVVSESGIELSQAVEAYAKTCFEFMTLQNQFLKTGHYASSSQSKLEAFIYSKPQAMKYYLVGLLLTYFWWENHFKILNYFFENTKMMKIGDSYLEIGVGHGLFAEFLDLNQPTTRYIGVDISQSSIDLACSISSMKKKNATIEYLLADATKVGLLPEEWASFAICCEVLEHVEEPKELLHCINLSMVPGGVLFLTTVCNLEAIDHIYQFDDVDSIRNLITHTGFEILNEVNFELSNTSSQIVMQSNYAAFVKKIN